MDRGLKIDSNFSGNIKCLIISRKIIFLEMIIFCKDLFFII